MCYFCGNSILRLYFAPGVRPITPTLLAVICHTAINVPITAHQWASWLFRTPSEAVLAVRDIEHASSNILVIFTLSYFSGGVNVSVL